MKNCRKCNTEKELIEFRKDKRYNDNLTNWCKGCIKVNTATWRAANVYQSRSHSMKWQKANPSKKLAINSKYYTSKLQRAPSWLTKEQLQEIEEFYILARELQWLNSPTDPLEVDHIVPLRGENVSGLHVPWNLQILPMSQNCSKKNKFK